MKVAWCFQRVSYIQETFLTYALFGNYVKLQQSEFMNNLHMDTVSLLFLVSCNFQENSEELKGENFLQKVNKGFDNVFT